MKKYIVLLFVAIMTLSTCSDWLDVVPDGVATLDMAFNSRTQALKYLATCYSYMPKNGGSADPATLGGDDIWT
ncbi:MAG: RagB/SusD family nutrient uptake outer membrane protein, partial [Petrimonas mucosa]